MLKGITIIAAGNPYYGRQAYNLAVSIKAVENFKVAVLSSGRALNHLSEMQKGVFDVVVPLPDSTQENSGVKLLAPEFTPFKETLLLDADMLWMPRKKPSDLFLELEGIEFTAITEGFYDLDSGTHEINPIYFFWAEPGEIAEVYKIKTGRIYQWRSEVMFFKKSAKVDKFFKLAQKVFENPKLKTIKYYAGGVADELAINVAAAVLKIDPHIYKWNPSYWHKLNGNIMPDLASIYNNYYLVSFGSNVAGGSQKKFYDRVMKASTHKLGLSHVFPLQSKKDYLPERQKM